MDSTQLLFFIITSLILIITPGPDMLLVMSRSIAMGQKAGISTAAGVSVGLLGHTLLATLGLGAILQTSAILFTTLKFIGAAYLIYLGIKSFRAPLPTFQTTDSEKVSFRDLFFQGAFSNLSNPKIAIFYFAFLPQFVSTDSTATTTVIFSLGVLFAILTFFIKAPVAFFSGKLSGWLRKNSSVQTWLNRICGGVLVGLGVRLAFETQAGK
jgi:RhtB (resistance to homoserine/threonine) family protein